MDPLAEWRHQAGVHCQPGKYHRTLSFADRFIVNEEGRFEYTEIIDSIPDYSAVVFFYNTFEKPEPWDDCIPQLQAFCEENNILYEEVYNNYDQVDIRTYRMEPVITADINPYVQDISAGMVMMKKGEEPKAIPFGGFEYMQMEIKRYFKVGSETVKALRGVSFKIYEGEFVTIQGTSGSGKSTLLNQLGCLDTPTSGDYFLDGISVREMSKTQRARLRNRKIGFVFQNYNLLAKTTAIENVELPLMYNSEVSASERRERAIKALQDVGLGDRLYHKSNQMSGGQMQRVAIARALVNDPAVLLADEATGNLDTRTSFEMLVLFQELYRKGHTIIFVTHNPEIAEYASRNINLRDGKIREDTRNENIKSAAEALAALPVVNDD